MMMMMMMMMMKIVFVKQMYLPIWQQLNTRVFQQQQL
jgi:hypothetical protein